MKNNHLPQSTKVCALRDPKMFNLITDAKFDERIYNSCNMIELNNQILIHTFGYPGAGKSHFASRFAEENALVYISADRFRYELFDDPQYTDAENQVIERLMDYMLEETFRAKGSVVFDSENSIRKARLVRSENAKKLGVMPLVVWIQTDLTTSFKRASKRDGRRPDDKYAFDINGKTFDSIISKMTPPSREESVVVSGKYDYAAQKATVIKKLEKMGLINKPQKQASRFQSRPTPPITRKRSIGGRGQFVS